MAGGTYSYEEAVRRNKLKMETKLSNLLWISLCSPTTGRPSVPYLRYSSATALNLPPTGGGRALSTTLVPYRHFLDIVSVPTVSYVRPVTGSPRQLPLSPTCRRHELAAAADRRTTTARSGQPTLVRCAQQSAVVVRCRSGHCAPDLAHTI